MQESTESTLRERYRYLAKDYIETHQGLFLAVVIDGVEQGRILSCLRYHREAGKLKKLSTRAAQEMLVQRYPELLFDSRKCDVQLPGVPESHVVRHYQPRSVLRARLSPPSTDQSRPQSRPVGGRWSLGRFGHPGGGEYLAMDSALRRAAGVFQDLSDCVGVTGSHLIGAANDSSDIDLVIYGLENFHRARGLLGRALAAGSAEDLGERDWRTSFERRGCADLSFAEYCWYERRKQNKFIVRGRDNRRHKVDLSCVDECPSDGRQPARKLGYQRIRARVISDRFAFASPAVFRIDHASIRCIVVFTATYVGQAFAGEIVEAAGVVEQLPNGDQRLIVGSSREATGEYIRMQTEVAS